jgi:hypothetical protein
MIRESMVDIQLQNLGLTHDQIHSVKARISNNKIPQFIERMIREKNIEIKQEQEAIKNAERQNESQHNNMRTNNQFSGNYAPRNIPESGKQKGSQMKEKYQDYTNRRNDIQENLELTARRLFGEPSQGEVGYTETFLNKKYKELALYYHPDKNEGDSRMFGLLQECYEYLHNNLPVHQSENKKIIDSAVCPPKELFKNKGFNVKDFNKYYSENALKPKEHGYGDWLQTNQKTPAQEKVSMSNFNNSFEDNRRKYEKMNPNLNALIRKNEPPEEIAANASLGNSVLGEDVLEDYSGSTNGMCYTDLKRAHEMSHLVYHTEEINENESMNSRFEEASQRNNSRPTKMLDDEFRRLEEHKQENNERERRRKYKLRQLDEDTSLHYLKVNRLSIR